MRRSSVRVLAVPCLTLFRKQYPCEALSAIIQRTFQNSEMECKCVSFAMTLPSYFSLVYRGRGRGLIIKTAFSLGYKHVSAPPNTWFCTYARQPPLHRRQERRFQVTDAGDGRPRLLTLFI